MILLTIPGRLPGLNEYVNAERSHRQKAAALKRDVQRRIALEIRSQLKGVRFSGPVFMDYTWIEPDRRRDKDNVAFARKFIQDALVHCGVLQNDGWTDVAGFTDCFLVDKENPRVEIRITTVCAKPANPASTTPAGGRVKKNKGGGGTK